jgi:hypothetical protein
MALIGLLSVLACWACRTPGERKALRPNVNLSEASPQPESRAVSREEVMALPIGTGMADVIDRFGESRGFGVRRGIAYEMYRAKQGGLYCIVLGPSASASSSLEAVLYLAEGDRAVYESPAEKRGQPWQEEIPELLLPGPHISRDQVAKLRMGTGLSEVMETIGQPMALPSVPALPYRAKEGGFYYLVFWRGDSLQQTGLEAVVHISEAGRGVFLLPVERSGEPWVLPDGSDLSGRRGGSRIGD